MRVLGLVVFLMGCRGSSEPTRLQSSEASSDKSAPVVMDLGSVHRPDGKEVLTASMLDAKALEPFLSGIGDLEAEELEVLLQAVNRTTASCEPCQSQGQSLGACALQELPSCKNLPSLIQRAFRVAIQGGDLAEAQKAISFVEPWQELPLLKGTSSAEVLVTFAVDYLDPFSHRAWKPWATLKQEYGDALSLQLLHLPHQRHQGAEDLAGLVLQASDPIAMHEAILEGGESPDLKALQKHPLVQTGNADSARAQLEVHRALANRLEVDSTPVVWVNGYRISGQREIGILQRSVDLALADKQDQGL